MDPTKHAILRISTSILCVRRAHQPAAKKCFPVLQKFQRPNVVNIYSSGPLVILAVPFFIVKKEHCVLFGHYDHLGIAINDSNSTALARVFPFQKRFSRFGFCLEC
jgi:hypothetical protein